MAADNLVRSREVSAMIKHGFIPNQPVSFSPSRPNPSRSSSYSPSYSPPPSSSSSPHHSLTRSTLFQMMSQEQHHLESSKQLKSKISSILSNAPFNNNMRLGPSDLNAYWTAHPGDVRLTVVATDGFRVSMDVHRRVLSEKSRYFAEKLRHEKGVSASHSVEIEISECDDVEVYVETVVLMYTDDLRKKLTGEDVNKVLGLLKVCSAIMYDDGISVCLEHLEAVPWSDNEEEKIISLLKQLQLDESAPEVLHRVISEPSTSARPDDMFMNLLGSVLQAKDDKARREMKMLISQLLREDSSQHIHHHNRVDVSRETLYHLCHRCLSALILCLSEATAMDDSKRDRGVLMAEIAREADNLHWIVDILIDKRMGEEFVKLWADQKELAILHSKIPTMYRHEISRITSQLCVAIGRGNILVPRETRLSLLLTWLEALYEDFGWMRRASRSMDRKVVEEGLGHTILTLPLPQQQAILVNWFDRYLNKGDDCPNIHTAFQIWWKRTFAKQQSTDISSSHLQITLSQYPNLNPM